MADKKYQHKIPHGYLKSWAHSNPRPHNVGKVWAFQKDDLCNPELKSPKTNFGEDDRYTLKVTGTRNVAVENALGMAEKWYSEAFVKIRAGKPLEGHDRVKVAFFAGAMMVRTDHLPRIMADMFKTIQRQAAKQEAKEGIDSSFSSAIAAALPDIVGDMVGVGMTENAKMLALMNLSIFVTDDEAGFVTGHEPCYVCVPAMPLSPRHLAYYSWKVPRMSYVAWGRDKVDRINSRTNRRVQKGIRFNDGHNSSRVVYERFGIGAEYSTDELSGPMET